MRYVKYEHPVLLWSSKDYVGYNTTNGLSFINEQQNCQQLYHQRHQQQQRDASNGLRERTFVCPDCGKAYAVYRSLWRHRKFECVNAKPKYTCEACPYKSPHKWCIENHKKKHHSAFF
ncbi:hypothetical protein KPH14_002498 [Odynerus spinipes]|uniref:C2H2-type domain-containing protein n=1 Tax=Odynerus spinipes TaxID=1348599 RepID=A0AAD9RS20_9HYME|nr:hypothetical protein KPH14_002498 [Odynerus spinipes]